MTLLRRAISLLILAIGAGCAAQPDSRSPYFIDCRSCGPWNQPVKPFQIYGNTYYVGVAGLSSILIDAGDRLVLIDGGLPQTAPLILQNIRALGFDPADVDAILFSHVHYDHVGGVASLQDATGATVYAHPLAVPVIRSARMSEDDPQFGYQDDAIAYPPITGEVISGNLEHLKIGNVWLHGVDTPGHTPSGMSWIWQSCVGDRCLDVVYADSLTPVSAEGYRFTDGLGGALLDSAHAIADLSCDIFLSTHASSFDMHAKLEKGWYAFIEGDGCIRYAKRTLSYLERRLAEEASELAEPVD